MAILQHWETSGDKVKLVLFFFVVVFLIYIYYLPTLFHRSYSGKQSCDFGDFGMMMMILQHWRTHGNKVKLVLFFFCCSFSYLCLLLTDSFL